MAFWTPSNPTINESLATTQGILTGNWLMLQGVLGSATLSAGITWAQGDIPYATGVQRVQNLAKASQSALLTNYGTTNNPSWVPTSSLTWTWQNLSAGSVVQVVNVTYTTVSSANTAMIFDDTVPVNNEGDEYMSATITPMSSANRLYINVLINLANANIGHQGIALFQDANPSALCATGFSAQTNIMIPVPLQYTTIANVTGTTTFKVRAGTNGGPLTFNGEAGSRIFGGTAISSIFITEVKV